MKNQEGVCILMVEKDNFANKRSFGEENEPLSAIEKYSRIKELTKQILFSFSPQKKGGVLILELLLLLLSLQFHHGYWISQCLSSVFFFYLSLSPGVSLLFMQSTGNISAFAYCVVCKDESKHHR